MLVELALTCLICILVATSALHIYWAFGGKWASKNVIPTLEGDKPLFRITTIPMFPTLMVAVLLIIAAGLFLWHAGVINIGLPEWLRIAGVWTVTVVFFARAIGEFRYVGFFKKIRDTGFGRLDTKVYSPLCLLVGILAVVVILGSPL